MKHFYTEEECQFIRNNIKGTSYKKMTEIFNEKFHTDIGIRAMSSKIRGLKLTNGLNGCFKPNRIPWNKGKRYIPGGRSHETRFVKGHTSLNKKPIGTERITKDGYLEVKVSEPDNWELKHRYIWEHNYGKPPEGAIVAFKDGNRLNVSLDNLALITRKENVIMNHSGTRYKNPKMFETGLLLAKIRLKESERKKQKNLKMTEQEDE